MAEFRRKRGLPSAEEIALENQKIFTKEEHDRQSWCEFKTQIKLTLAVLLFILLWRACFR